MLAIIKLVFFSLLFVFLVTAMAGPLVALVALVIVVGYGIASAITRQRRIARQERQEKLVVDLAVISDHCAIAQVKRGDGSVLTDEAILMLCNPN